MARHAAEQFHQDGRTHRQQVAPVRHQFLRDRANPRGGERLFE